MSVRAPEYSLGIGGLASLAGMQISSLDQQLEAGRPQRRLENR